VNRFFLFIGSTKMDAALSKLKAADVLYRQKRLESGPTNWRAILELVEDPALIGVVAKITGDNYRTLLDPEYGGLLTFPWVGERGFHRGSGGQRPARLSIARAIRAPGLWKP
jgi:hypothetical protein